MYKKNKFLKLSEAARRLGVSRSCLIKWDTQGKIKIKWRRKGVAVITEGAIENFLISKESKRFQKNMAPLNKIRAKILTGKTIYNVSMGERFSIWEDSEIKKKTHIHNLEKRITDIRRGKW